MLHLNQDRAIFHSHLARLVNQIQVKVRLPQASLVLQIYSYVLQHPKQPLKICLGEPMPLLLIVIWIKARFDLSNCFSNGCDNLPSPLAQYQKTFGLWRHGYPLSVSSAAKGSSVTGS
ncbi:MAG: hypothetical protein WD118_05325 [Phycisphaeraceae bacterium]